MRTLILASLVDEEVGGTMAGRDFFQLNRDGPYFDKGDVMVSADQINKLPNILNDTRKYMLVTTVFLALSYSVYLIFSDDTIIRLGIEDGFFENLTAICFLVASIILVRIWYANRNIWFLLLGLMLFVGCGEEISWGQRIFDFSTPGMLKSLNRQGEFNLHNIIFFNTADNPGVKRFHTVEFLFKVFWLTYGVLLPAAVLKVRSVGSLVERFRLPIPPLSIGVFFFINWAVFHITLSYLLPPHKPLRYYLSLIEIMECGSAFIFMVIAVWFYKYGSQRWIKVMG